MPRKTALQKAQARGLSVTPTEIAQYPYDHIDVAIAEAMLQGLHTPKDIAGELGVAASLIRQRLLDPVRCAWLSVEVGKAVETRMFQALGAVFARVIRTGDPAGMRVLLQQFGKNLKPQEHVHRHVLIDFTALSTDELKRYVQDQGRKLGQTVVDAEFSEKQEPFPCGTTSA